MRCDEIQEKFIDLLYDEQGTPPAGPELLGHLNSCPGCRAELERLQGLQQSLRTWEEVPPLRPTLIPWTARAGLDGRKSRTLRYLRYAAAAAAALLALLAISNAEIGWNRDGFSFRTTLLKNQEPAGDYYTKKEIRTVLKEVLDDSEARMTETNYLLMQQVMDMLEQERLSDLRLIRSRAGRARAGN